MFNKIKSAVFTSFVLYIFVFLSCGENGNEYKYGTVTIQGLPSGYMIENCTIYNNPAIDWIWDANNNRYSTSSTSYYYNDFRNPNNQYYLSQIGGGSLDADDPYYKLRVVKIEYQFQDNSWQHKQQKNMSFTYSGSASIYIVYNTKDSSQRNSYQTFVFNNVIFDNGHATVNFSDAKEPLYRLDVSNWPQEANKNDFWQGMYYRKSDNSIAMAVNLWSYKQEGTDYRPSIFILEESTGDFPLGKWGHANNNNNNENWDIYLIFTSTTITLDRSEVYDLTQVDYTMTENMFYTSNLKTIPYTPTEDDKASLATYNETAFRSSRPWIPSTSTIDVKVKRGNWIYNISDNPTMPSFVNNADIEGTWLVCDFTDNPNTYNPQNPEWPDADTWRGIKFNADETVQYLYWDTNEWGESGIWASTSDTYTARFVTGEEASGIIKENHWTTAPEFVVKQYSDGLYLFAQWKSGDYSYRTTQPSYYVFKKQ